MVLNAISSADQIHSARCVSYLREFARNLPANANGPIVAFREEAGSSRLWRIASRLDAASKQNFTAYKLLFTDVVDGRQVAVPRAVMAAGNVMQGSRGGVDLPQSDIARVKNHLAKYYKNMGETAPWSGADDLPGPEA